VSERRVDTGWLDDAIAFAVASHAGQARKGSDTPYIVHPLRVALSLERHGFGRGLVIAGLLHDVVEDCGVTVDDIARRFGAPVAALVGHVTERKHDRGAARPWRDRKQDALAELAAAPVEVAALKAADTLDNVRSMVEDHARIGDRLWQRFNAAPGDQLWYYAEVSSGVGRRLGGHALAGELAQAVAALTRAVGGASGGAAPT
jgi:(p)ppGpp synthase/HD superfamily hydrolase